MDLKRYAMNGVAPRHAVRPASREEAAEALRAADRDRRGVVPWGGGVALPFEAAPAGYDVALDLTALDRIVEYEPADLTLTAECGVTIATLRATLAAQGQELPLEAAHADRATLGGVLAANASGPRRRRFGAPRDRILGARYLFSDGSGARTGGKVVKNVAGYGLHRLLCGSRGGLGIILEASLKLQPAPASRVALIYDADAALLADRSRWAPFARMEPAALTVVSAAIAPPELAGAASRFAVVVVLEDDEPWVAEQERAVANALGTPARRLGVDGVSALLERLADLEERSGPRLTFTSADASPAAVGELLAASDPDRHADLPAFLFHALAGRLHLWPADGRASVIATALAEAGMSLIGARGTDPIEPPSPPQVAVRTMRGALRNALDPAGRFILGASWGGEMRE
ncbi:MAG: FAD-binding oxidoreductase [Candidatus Eisenbacteria bacterium]